MADTNVNKWEKGIRILAPVPYTVKEEQYKLDEEQNYNMIDNVLNNGVGEKAEKEAEKREQEKSAAKVSLKARLAEKKAQVAGQNHEKDNNRKTIIIKIR